MNDQKLENLLNLALDATSEELERSERLSEGYDRADNTWDLIIKYNGDLTELEREGAVFTPLVNEIRYCDDPSGADSLAGVPGTGGIY